MTLTEAAAQADELAQSGSERELATLRQQWDEEVESAARSGDYRERAVAYRAIGQFRFRQKLELLRRGLEDDSPAEQLRSEEHTSELQSRRDLVCRLLLEKKNRAMRSCAAGENGW